MQALAHTLLYFGPPGIPIPNLAYADQILAYQQLHALPTKGPCNDLSVRNCVVFEGPELKGLRIVQLSAKGHPFTVNAVVLAVGPPVLERSGLQNVPRSSNLDPRGTLFTVIVVMITVGASFVERLGVQNGAQDLHFLDPQGTFLPLSWRRCEGEPGDLIFTIKKSTFSWKFGHDFQSNLWSFGHPAVKK